MRKLSDITELEIDEVRKIVCGYMENWRDVEYQCFGKSRSIFSGYKVVKVYEYLKSINIGINLKN